MTTPTLHLAKGRKILSILAKEYLNDVDRDLPRVDLAAAGRGRPRDVQDLS